MTYAQALKIETILVAAEDALFECGAGQGNRTVLLVQDALRSLVLDRVRLERQRDSAASVRNLLEIVAHKESEPA